MVQIRQYGRDKSFVNKVKKIIENSVQTIPAVVQYCVWRTFDFDTTKGITAKEFQPGNLSFIENEMANRYLIEGNSLIFKLRRIHYIKRNTKNKELFLIPKIEPKFIAEIYHDIQGKVYHWNQISDFILEEPKIGIVEQHNFETKKSRRSSHISRLEFAFGFRKILKDSGFAQTKSNNIYTFKKENLIVTYYMDTGKIDVNTIGTN